MFEKDAEEKANEKYPIPQVWNEIHYVTNRKYAEGFQDGAEFGYNKANEWHYVKDGDLPKDGETVLVCRDDIQIWTGNRHSKRENSYFWYVHNLHGVMYKDSDIYAWKEIVLPKEVEE